MLSTFLRYSSSKVKTEDTDLCKHVQAMDPILWFENDSVVPCHDLWQSVKRLKMYGSSSSGSVSFQELYVAYFSDPLDADFVT